MKDLVEYIAKSIVTKPEEVRVLENKISDYEIQLELYVAEEDLGRVIGKRGKVAKNIRNILRAISIKESVNYNLKIMETD
ncbi:KH domain-containing protein [Neofamilia massiliensis]|uniref:KH domain-containing protein n=1 Tax=Neofamilia massiliensis TaxID=1673724 RepID=UPI0006BB7FD7|nr:KH domain-containing protein [Neofamilia massiliensis]